MRIPLPLPAALLSHCLCPVNAFVLLSLSFHFRGLWEGTEISSCPQSATLYESLFKKRKKEKGCVGHLKTRVQAKPVLWAIA